jgi:hypothetical protein
MPLRRGAEHIFHQQFLKALDDLEASPDTRRQAHGDPHKFFKDHGVDLPDDAEIEVRPDNWSVRVSLAWGLIDITVSGG